MVDPTTFDDATERLTEHLARWVVETVEADPGSWTASEIVALASNPETVREVLVRLVADGGPLAKVEASNRRRLYGVGSARDLDVVRCSGVNRHGQRCGWSAIRADGLGPEAFESADGRVWCRWHVKQSEER